MNFRKLAVQSVVNAMVLDEGWNYDEAKKEHDTAWVDDEENYFSTLPKKSLKKEIKLQKKQTTSAKTIGRKRDRKAVTWEEVWNEIDKQVDVRRLEYKQLEGGLIAIFKDDESKVFKGEIKEKVEYLDVVIDVISLSDEVLKDFDWEENYDEFGLWTGESNAVTLLDLATEGNADDAYIWCSALLFAKGSYHIVTLDFFQDLFVNN